MPPAIETSPTKADYRADIDGLRAVAVVLVVVYHMAAQAMPAGYTGVDVFFVISGYLISGLILKALEDDRFSFATFYGRRIRRIAPALLVMITATLAGGAALLIPGDLEDVASSALFSLVGASNYYFLNHTGYFDFSASMLPLLHTWSLGVEEQFYLAWPLLLVLLYRLTHGHRAKMAAAIIVLVAASFVLFLWLWSYAPKHAFYQPFSRAWQLGLGALMVLVPKIAHKGFSGSAARLLPLSGLTMIFAAGLGLKPEEPYSGLNGLLPTIGSALVLYDCSVPTIASRLLSTPPLLFVGKISYSLYLWHWPILVLWRHSTLGEQVGNTEAVALTAVSFIVATLSWRYIETPTRQSSLSISRLIERVCAGAAAIALAASALIVIDGLPQRLPEDVRGLASRKRMWAWDCPQKVELPVPAFDYFGSSDHHCAFGANWFTASDRAILWGDSNAQHFAPLLDLLGRERDLAFVLVAPCPAVVTLANEPKNPAWPTYGRQCAEQRAAVIEYLASDTAARLIILSARWSNLSMMLHDSSNIEAPTAASGARLLAESMDHLLGQIGTSNRHILVIADIPGIAHRDPIGCVLARAQALPRLGECAADLERLAYQQLSSYQLLSHGLLASVVARSANASVLRPGDGLCDRERCRTVVAGEFIYRDPVHIRRNLKAATLRALDASIGVGAFLDSIGLKKKAD